jgi:virulence-associated protein VagC
LQRISPKDILAHMPRHKAQESVVFQSGNSLAVRLVGDCRLPRGTRIREYRQGDRIVLQPVSDWPKAFRNAMGAFADEIPRPEDERKQRNPFA